MSGLRYISACVLALLLAGCGGGGGGNNSPSFHGSSTSGQAGAVSGAVTKGPLQGATVDRFAIDPAGQKQGASTENATTDGSGNFNFASSVADATLIETCGGVFADESDPATPKRQIPFSSSPCQGLKGILPANAMTVAITPVSQALYEKSLRETDAVTGDFETVYGNNRANFQAVLGFDPVLLIPPDPINPTGSTEEKQYAMLLGGIAQVINAAATKMNMPAPSHELIKAVITDLSDGRIDGRRNGVSVQVGECGPQLPGDIDLNAEINRFRNNNANAYAGVPLLVIDEDQLSQDGSVEVQEIHFRETFEPDSPTVSGWLEDRDLPETFWQLIQAGHGIVNTLVPIYVSLAPNDTSGGALPDPGEGNFSYWYGDAALGNFIGEQDEFDSPNSGGNSTAAHSGTLTSPSIDLGAVNGAVRLTFLTWWEIESASPASYDEMIILLSLDDGISWQQVAKLNSDLEQSCSGGGGGPVPFTNRGLNQAPAWIQQKSISLPGAAGKPDVRLRFQFSTDDGAYNGFRGWLIDDVIIKSGNGEF